MKVSKSRIFPIFALVSLILSAFIIINVTGKEAFIFDEVLTLAYPEWGVPFFEFITELGSTLGIGTTAILFIIWLWWRNRDYVGMAVVVFAVALGNEVNKWIKDSVGRARPVTAPSSDLDSLSFPSGHAMVGMILYMLIAYFIIKELNSKSMKWMVGVVAGIIIVLVGVSRNVLGAHYPSDVWGGFFLGFVWTYLFIWLYETVKRKVKRKPI